MSVNATRSSALMAARSRSMPMLARMAWNIKIENTFYDIERRDYFAISRDVPSNDFIHILVNKQPNGFSFTLTNYVFWNDDSSDDFNRLMLNTRPGDVWTVMSQTWPTNETKIITFKHTDFIFQFRGTRLR